MKQELKQEVKVKQEPKVKQEVEGKTENDSNIDVKKKRKQSDTDISSPLAKHRKFKP